MTCLALDDPLVSDPSVVHVNYDRCSCLLFKLRQLFSVGLSMEMCLLCETEDKTDIVREERRQENKSIREEVDCERRTLT